MDIASRGLTKVVKNQVLDFISLFEGGLRLDFMNGEWMKISIPNYQINMDRLQFFFFDSRSACLSDAAIEKREKNPDPTATVPMPEAELTTEEDLFGPDSDLFSTKPPEERALETEDSWPLPLNHKYVQSYIKNQPVEFLKSVDGKILIRFENTNVMQLDVDEFTVLLYDNTGETLDFPKLRPQPERRQKPVLQTPQEKIAIAESVNESLRIMCKLGKVPHGSTVTKRTGEKLYETRDGIRIFKKGGSDRIAPPENHTFLCADYGTFDCMSNDTIVCWVVSREELMEYLQTHPLPY